MGGSAFFVFSVLVALASAGPSLPSPRVGFDDVYSVEGVLILPYAELREPFNAYYDKPRNRSRIDYYGDLVLTVQRGDKITNQHDDDVLGISYKIAYNVDKTGRPGRVCFQVNGSDLNPVGPQAALPDLSEFKYAGHEPCPIFGAEVPDQRAVCEVWKLVTQIGEKKNKYRFWLKRDKTGRPIPVHYNMEGFNSLFGSHYDKYEISYKNYRRNAIAEEVFGVADNMTCTGFPGPGAGIIHLHNPMSEFINSEGNREKLIEQTFMQFKKKHSKNYDNQTEEELRKTYFRHNHRFVESHNRKNLHFKLKVNHLADWADWEFRMLRGRLRSKGYNGGKPFDKPEMNRPTELDWRLAGAVTPVKDQAVCGSCWSFGTVGTIEGANFVKTGHLISLSEQQLIDCSWDQGDNGCDGGEDFRAYHYIMRAGGLAASEDYGPYLGQDGKCHDRGKMPKVVKLAGFVNVTSNDPEALELAMFKHGPVTVAIDASQKTFSFYSHGVYYDPECGSTPDDLDHQVLAVGYGTLYGKKYWLVKNSWSTYWGNDGYILMAQKNNNCGVMTSPTYPVIG